MFESLSRMQNPVPRSVTDALTTFSVITLASAIAIVVTKLKDESAYTIVCASLLGAGCGALFGLASKGKGTPQNAPQAQGDGQSTQAIDTALIQSLVMQDAEYFLCGSPPFTDAIRAGLRAVNVPESRVFFEMFTKASLHL